MKYLLLLIFLVSSCVVPTHTELIVTTVYVGKFIESLYANGHTQIVTDQITVSVRGNIIVPEGAHCYVKRNLSNYDMHPDIAWQLEKQKFFWVGSDKYRIIRNIHFK